MMTFGNLDSEFPGPPEYRTNSLACQHIITLCLYQMLSRLSKESLDFFLALRKQKKL